jgi:hypothetical protein
VPELANQPASPTTLRFALARLGSNTLSGGDPRRPKPPSGALAAAVAARAPWVVAYARVQLGRVLAAAGDADTDRGRDDVW